MPKSSVPEITETPEQVGTAYYLKQAHIHEYRSIRDAKAEFKAGLNIIIGPNGSGKTNFIQCIRKGIDHLANNGIHLHNKTKIDLLLDGRNILTIEYKMRNDKIIDNYAEFNLANEYQPKFSVNTETATIEESSLAAALSKLKPLVNDATFKVISINHGIPISYPFVEKSAEITLGLLLVDNQRIAV